MELDVFDAESLINKVLTLLLKFCTSSNLGFLELVILRVISAYKQN